MIRLFYIIGLSIFFGCLTTNMVVNPIAVTMMDWVLLVAIISSGTFSTMVFIDKNLKER